jgi:hypothetical protein
MKWAEFQVVGGLSATAWNGVDQFLGTWLPPEQRVQEWHRTYERIPVWVNGTEVVRLPTGGLKRVTPLKFSGDGVIVGRADTVEGGLRGIQWTNGELEDFEPDWGSFEAPDGRRYRSFGWSEGSYAERLDHGQSVRIGPTGSSIGGVTLSGEVLIKVAGEDFPKQSYILSNGTGVPLDPPADGWFSYGMAMNANGLVVGGAVKIDQIGEFDHFVKYLAWKDGRIVAEIGEAECPSDWTDMEVQVNARGWALIPIWDSNPNLPFDAGYYEEYVWSGRAFKSFAGLAEDSYESGSPEILTDNGEIVCHRRFDTVVFKASQEATDRAILKMRQHESLLPKGKVFTQKYVDIVTGAGFDPSLGIDGKNYG